METNGNLDSIYERLKEEQDYPSETDACIKDAVEKLLETDTAAEKPGVLLGVIQGGKTKAIFGISALAFDKGYDLVIVLTKGTKALTQQTYERLSGAFKRFSEDEQVKLFDIMHLPPNLTGYELRQKLIIVSKKEAKNLRRLNEAITSIYPSIRKKKTLIIDDEADIASVGFRRTKAEGVKLNEIARLIDQIRRKLECPAFLQVTATPYSLYLQPTDLVLPNTQEVFKPIKPAFTAQVPPYEGYVGGDFYFKESLDEGSIAYYLYKEVSPRELGALKKEHKRRVPIEEVLVNKNIAVLREAIINFIVGACVSRVLEKQEGNIARKYSFIVHTETKRESHEWQTKLVSAIRDKLIDAKDFDPGNFEVLIKEAYQRFIPAFKVLNKGIPDFISVKEEIADVIDGLSISKVNCDGDIKELLDETGQLKLRTPLNIFIGGQILDRGLTIGNLIGFYYGRTPSRFQQDTVLQHSRMYGNRPILDLAVTRFYTSPRIYSAMKTIHDLDAVLREDLRKPLGASGVVFLHKDETGNIINCSPNKIILSSITTLKPSARALPLGFQLKSKRECTYPIGEVDRIIQHVLPELNKSNITLIGVDEAVHLVELINETFDFETDGYYWDVIGFIEAIRYASNNCGTPGYKGKVYLKVCAKELRTLTRYRPTGRLSDAPDSYQEREESTKLAAEIPCLLLIKQAGSKESGWRGFPFWWPVLRMPANMNTIIYAAEIGDS